MVLKANIIKNNKINSKNYKMQYTDTATGKKNNVSYNVKKISTKNIQRENSFSNNYKSKTNNGTIKQNYLLNTSNKNINITDTGTGGSNVLYNNANNQKSNYTNAVNFNGNGSFLGGYKTDLSFLSGTATTVIVGTKVASGVLDVAENIYDGMQWTQEKIVEGGSFAVAQLVGLIDHEAKNSILDWRESEKKSVKEHIAINMVDNLEQKVFNTKIGSFINENSYIKYDSDFANKIENITKSWYRNCTCYCSNNCYWWNSHCCCCWWFRIFIWNW